MKLSKSEEDYLKALFTIEYKGEKSGTNSLADALDISPASVNNMLKKLKLKDLVDYKKYSPIKLTDKGRSIALGLIRKHRLWETFLYEKLKFTWDEVHEVAEQMEHIRSTKLTERLAEFLGNPKLDPHGDPIPDSSGNIAKPHSKTLADLKIGEICKVVAVNDESEEFLRHATKLGIELDIEIKVIEKLDFDGSMKIEYSSRIEVISKKFSENVYVDKL